MKDKQGVQIREFTLDEVVKDYLARCGPKGYFALVLEEGKVVVGSSARAVRNYMTSSHALKGCPDGQLFASQKAGFPSTIILPLPTQFHDVHLDFLHSH